MSQEQDAIIEDEPLKVLGLFQKRQLTTINFNQQKFLKLYDSLCCTICRELFNNPVYLRCSHRFCKQCIEKYIRFNDKKSCPNCRGDLATKRDLRFDYGLSSLINYAFGDAKKFSQQVQQIENLEALTLQKSASKNSAISGIVRSKSFVEQEQKSIRKKVKVTTQNNGSSENGGQQKNKKKRSKTMQNSKIEDSSRTEEIRLQNNQTTTNQKTSKTQDKVVVNIQLSAQNQKVAYQQGSISQSVDPFRGIVRRKRGRKKQTPIIEVKSHSQEQIQQVKNSQPLPLPNLLTVNSKIQSKKQIKISSEKSIKDIKQPEKISKQIQKIVSQNRQKQPQRNIQAQSKYNDFQKQKGLLRQQLGQNYMFKLMKIPLLDFLIEIKLQKYPDCFLTPNIQCKSIQISAKAKIKSVFVLLSKLLNVSVNNLRLYINCASQTQKISELPFIKFNSHTIGQINQNYWKTVYDVRVFDMKQILSSLEDARGEIGKQTRQNNEIFRKNKLFENIEVQKDQRQNQTKKRGRGRGKKTQDKEGNTDQKQQFKRVFYYQISTS